MVTTWEPMRDFVALQDAMDRFVGEGRMRNGNGKAASHEFRPAVDAWEDEDAVVLEMALPGLKAEDVDVTFDKDSLTVSGLSPARDEEKTWVLLERPRGEFKRRFALQTPIDVDQVRASFSDGILSLHLPKVEAVKPRKIEVVAG
jgi:HSP20 family protein